MVESASCWRYPRLPGLVARITRRHEPWGKRPISSDRSDHEPPTDPHSTNSTRSTKSSNFCLLHDLSNQSHCRFPPSTFRPNLPTQLNPRVITRRESWPSPARTFLPRKKVFRGTIQSHPETTWRYWIPSDLFLSSAKRLSCNKKHPTFSLHPAKFP